MGAAVIFIRAGDPGRLFLGVTDVSGYFRFESVPEGTWTMGVVREGAVPLLKDGISVKPPARAVVDIVLKKSASRIEPPVFDLSRFERQPGVQVVGRTEESAQQGNAPPAPAGEASDGDASASGALIVRVLDNEMNSLREARVSLRSRGPRVDPLRGVTDDKGEIRLRRPEPGEYLFRVDVPGYLPARIDRLVLGHTPPLITAVMTTRPIDYPARPAELLPEEKPVPPEGFPGSRENKPPSTSP